MTSRRSSGSSWAERAVEPTTSQNRTVSWRRSASLGGGPSAVDGRPGEHAVVLTVEAGKGGGGGGGEPAGVRGGGGGRGGGPPPVARLSPRPEASRAPRIRPPEEREGGVAPGGRPAGPRGGEPAGGGRPSDETSPNPQQPN